MNELQQIKIDINQLARGAFPKCQKGMGHVYIIESDGCVKIGVSTDVLERLNSIRTQSGRDIKKVFVTENRLTFYSQQNAG